MRYELYTALGCYQCVEVENFLNKKNISYEEISLTTVEGLTNREGSKTFGKIYSEIESKFKLRKTNRGKTALPLLVEKNESGKVERIAQELEEIKALFE